MDIRFLATFIEVSKTRHFGKAAENLYLTQSAISARIKHLEEYFNAPLFIRHRHSIQLTSAGEKLLPYAERLTSTLNEARKSLSDVDVEHIVLAGTPNAWEVSLQYDLVAIKKHFSELSVRAEILNSEQLSRQLHEHIVDLAFSIEPFKSDDVESILLGQSPLGFYSTKQTVLESALSDYVHIDWGIKTTEVVEKKYPTTKKASLRTGSALVGIEYIIKHGGVVLLPESIGKQYVLNGQLVQLNEIDEIHVRTFLTFLRSSIQTGLKEIIEFFNKQHSVEL